VLPGTTGFIYSYKNRANCKCFGVCLFHRTRLVLLFMLRLHWLCTVEGCVSLYLVVLLCMCMAFSRRDNHIYLGNDSCHSSLLLFGIF